MALHVPTAPPSAEPSTPAQAWLTTVLRPAGALTGRAGARFAAALRAASASSGVVMVDLRAVGPLPRPVRQALADADALLTRTGGALLVIDGQEEDGRPALPPRPRLLEPGIPD
jgi:hypothetical protein